MRRASVAARLALVALSLLLAAAAAELALRAAGLYARQSRKAQDPSCGPPPAGVTRLLCIGESTTAPTGRGESDHSWPKELERLLALRASGRRFEVVNAGTIATNSAVLLSRLPGELACYQPHAVVAMVGINDDRWYGRWASVSEERGFSWRSLRLAKVAAYAWHEGPWARRAQAAPAAKAPEPRLAGPDDLSKCLVQYPSFEYVDWSRAQRLLPVCRAAAARLPEDFRPQYALGMIYWQQGRRADAAQAMEKARALGGLETVAFPLSWIYQQQKRYADAEELLKDAVSRYPSNQTFRMRLSRLYDFERRFDLARAQLEGAGGEGGFAPDAGAASATPRNYRGIRELVRRAGVPLVAMQYPGLPLSALQAYFPDAGGVLWVDNAPSFAQARKPGRYAEYFVDKFAGDWGHCTPKGNRLIAENVARVLEQNGLLAAAGGER